MGAQNIDDLIAVLLQEPRFVDAVGRKILEDPDFRSKVAELASNGNGDFLLFSFRDVHQRSDGDKYELFYQDPVATKISQKLDKKLGHVTLDKFADGSSLFTINENARRRDVYIVFNPDPEKDLDGEIMRFMMFAQTLKRSNARNIVAVVPNLPYSRQDTSYGRRQMVTSRFIADMLRESGISHMITVGLHSPQIEGFYKNLDHLRTKEIFSDYLRTRVPGLAGQAIHLEQSSSEEDYIRLLRDNVVLGSVDAGGMKPILYLRRTMDPQRLIDVAFVQKERVGVNQAESGIVVGDVRGKIVILYDDILDTGGSLFGAAKALKREGAVYVIGCIDHALGNTKEGDQPFDEKLLDSELDELVVTDTNPRFYERVLASSYLQQRVSVLSTAPLLAEAIKRDRHGGTIHDMMDHVPRNTIYEVLHERRAA